MADGSVLGGDKLRVVNGVLQRAQVVAPEDKVNEAVQRLASALNKDFFNQSPLVICILNGGLYLTGQLLPLLDFPLRLSYLHASRYGDETRGKQLQWKARVPVSLQGESVLLIDDILDEGHTLAEIQAYCRESGAASVHTVVGIEKRHERRVAGVTAEYVGMQVGDRFLFGFGMDYQGYFRNLPAVYAVTE